MLGLEIDSAGDRGDGSYIEKKKKRKKRSVMEEAKKNMTDLMSEKMTLEKGRELNIPVTHPRS